MNTHDTTSTIAALYVYPIKSCAGISLSECVLTDTGLDLDRAWMVTDEAGHFVTQRELPRMALIQPTLKTYEMVLRAPGMLALHITIDAVEKPCTVQVWSDTCAAYDMGDTAAQWFTDFLAQDLPAGQVAKKLRLVRFDPEHQRISNKKWTGTHTAYAQFADGYSMLVISQASLDGLNQRLTDAGHAPVGMARFRPNIVLSGIEAHDEDRLEAFHTGTGDEALVLTPVKPCPRCPIPNIDPATAVSSPHVGDALQAYRSDPRVDGALTFGMNVITTQGLSDGKDLLLRVGQTLQANYKFD
jgi:uncharacterized protein